MHNFKDRINKNKEKVEIIKELNKLNDIIEQANSEKVKIFVESGIEIHKKIRKKEITQDCIIGLFEGISEIDKTIYEANLEINKITLKNEMICECGNRVDVENNFCCICGKKIDYEKNTIKCQHCFSEIDENSIYCGCCGQKIVKDI